MAAHLHGTVWRRQLNPSMLGQGRFLRSLVAGHLVWNQLKYSQYFQDLRVLIAFDERIPLIKDAAQVKISVLSSLCQLSIELSTALVSSCATYASNVTLHRHIQGVFYCLP